MSFLQQPLGILGVPIFRVTLEEAVREALHLIDSYPKDLLPRYIATLNVTSLTQAHGWNFVGVRDPELLEVLRDAAMGVPEGRALIWLSYCLGEPLKERVPGLDLLTLLSEKLGEEDQSCFLLGGSEKGLKLCTLYLQALYSDLKIAGTSFSLITTQGAELHQSEEKDLLLVEHINRPSPDVLFINLGTPKQEIWYNRVKDRLHVPVNIGVGDAFERLAGIAPRASRFKRLLHEPYRLWSHYFYDIAKFTFMVAPLILYHTLSRILFWLFFRNRQHRHPFSSTELFVSSHQTVAVVKLPLRLDERLSQMVNEEMEDLFSQDVVLIDFKAVRHIDLTGMGLILTLWQRALKEKKQLYGIHLSADVALLLRLHRVFDLVRDSICPDLHDLITRLRQHRDSSSFYDSIQQNHQIVTISFFGRLNHEFDVEAYLRKIEPVIHQKECILDFTYCTYLDNRAIGFLIKLAEKRARQHLPIKLTGLSKQLKRQLRLAKVIQLFDIV